MGKDREDELWPSWIRLSTQVEPVREFYRKEMQRHAELFEKVMDALWKKIEGGRSGEIGHFFPGGGMGAVCSGEAFMTGESRHKHFVVPNHYTRWGGSLDVICTGRQDPPERVFFIQSYDTDTDPSQKMEPATFICLKGDWDKSGGYYRYDYAKRTLRLDLPKLAETALTVVEQNPPEDRKWIQEEGATYRYDVDVERNLKDLLEQIALWTPVNRIPQTSNNGVSGDK